MKKLTATQIQNIVFTAIVAIAAVLLYLLAGRGGGVNGILYSATPTATAEATPQPEPRFVPVPEDIFLLGVTSSESFRAGRRKEEPNAYNIVCGDEYTGAAVLTYSVNEKCEVNAFALRFEYQEEPNEKSKATADVVYASLYPTYIARQNTAVETILRELLACIDLNGVFSEPILLRWYTGAVSARDFKKYYSETYERCEFLAYPSQWGADNVVICSMMEK